MCFVIVEKLKFKAEKISVVYLINLYKEGRNMLKRKSAGNSGKKSGFKRKNFFKKKVCRFCAKKIDEIDYKDVPILKRYVTDRGKILSQRISGACAKHQRRLCKAIKRARIVGLLPFSSS